MLTQFPMLHKMMSFLQTICPEMNEELIRNPCNGDQASIDRMTGVKKSYIKDISECEQFAGLMETPQEFYKEAIFVTLLIKSWCYFHAGLHEQTQQRGFFKMVLWIGGLDN